MNFHLNSDLIRACRKGSDELHPMPAPAQPRSNPCSSALCPSGQPSGWCALTTGVDAGVADRFVFVASRVFLQFTQDLLHGRLRASGESGCVWAVLCVVVGGYFKGSGTVTTSPNAMIEMRAMIHSHRAANDIGPRPSVLWWKQEAGVFDSVSTKMRRCNSQRKGAKSANK